MFLIDNLPRHEKTGKKKIQVSATQVAKSKTNDNDTWSLGTAWYNNHKKQVNH